MKMFVVATMLSIVALAAAEPPAPRNYIPPATNYLPPTNSYEAAANNQFNSGYNYNQAPSNSYQAPQTSYGAPSANGNGNGNGNEGYEYNNNAEPAKYSFEYKVEDYPSGNDFGHMESRDGDRTVGRYYVLLPDGRKQIVNYEADKNGYRPTITYEETNNGNNNNNNGYGNNNNNNNNQGFTGY